MDRFRKIAIAAAGGVLLIAPVVSATTASAASAHVVKPGETLSGIAAANGVSVDSLVSLNSIKNPDLIYVGDQIDVFAASDHVSNDAQPAAPAPQDQPAPKAVTPAPQPKTVAPPAVSSSSCLDNIIQHESGGNPTAVNPSSGTYGLAQWLPGTGPGIGASYATQYAAAHDYAVARYGGDCQAWAFWQAHQWW